MMMMMVRIRVVNVIGIGRMGLSSMSSVLSGMMVFMIWLVLLWMVIYQMLRRKIVIGIVIVKDVVMLERWFLLVRILSFILMFVEKVVVVVNMKQCVQLQCSECWKFVIVWWCGGQKQIYYSVVVIMRVRIEIVISGLRFFIFFRVLMIVLVEVSRFLLSMIRVKSLQCLVMWWGCQGVCLWYLVKIGMLILISVNSMKVMIWSGLIGIRRKRIYSICIVVMLNVQC